MSDWMLYHVWRIRGYEVKHCERVEPERLVVTITAKPNALCCPCCGSKDVIRKGVNLRMLRGVPVGGGAGQRPWAPDYGRCQQCGGVLVPRVDELSACRRCEVCSVSYRHQSLPKTFQEQEQVWK